MSDCNITRLCQTIGQENAFFVVGKQLLSKSDTSNQRLGIKLLKIAASSGQRDACNILGHFYCSSDINLSIHYFRQANNVTQVAIMSNILQLYT